MLATPRSMDATDPLAHLRSRFVGVSSALSYFDGNSLGRPLCRTGPELATFVEEEWGGRLIRGWDERWFDLPLVVGDELGRITLGAGPGQTAVGDSTTVLLYKLVRAAVAARPGRTQLVVDRSDFPTVRYVAEGVAAECGLTVRWIDVDPQAGATPEQVDAATGADTALVLLSHVAYRSAWIVDAPRVSEIAHEAGALVLWDLSHSVGSVPLELDAWEVDLAVGCSYKYLNGGPGAPAFLYVAERHLDALTQPIQGWMGAADPFSMGPEYQPAAGVRRFLSGTPPVTGMLAIRHMLELIDEVGMAAVRDKSVALTSYLVDLADEVLAPFGVALASPREPRQRGGHVTLRHPLARELTTALWRRDVIPDYRDPGGLRLGLSPLSTSFAEVHAGVLAVREELERLS